MKQHVFWRLVLATAALAVVGCRNEVPSKESGGRAKAASTKRIETVRGPAVAGSFYPGRETDLKQTVERMLAKAKGEPVKNLRALVCPHAGYPYSAPIAATGYKQLVGRDYSTVILLGPSHYVGFTGAFVSTVDAWKTPLGLVPVSSMAAEMAKKKPFVTSSPNRPQGKDTPETREHSIEVQLPFLQYTLSDLSIVPIIFGQVDPKQVAEAILPFLDDDTLIVVSTDLSHYLPYEEAKARDTRCVKAICDLQADHVEGDDACGHSAVQTLIEIARQKHWKTRLLDYRNSGDTSGDKQRVVGYAAIAFFAPEGAASAHSAKSHAPEFTRHERRLLLELARKSVMAAVTGGEAPKADDVPEKFRARRACFVTLTKNGRLRGCIGSIFPVEPLYEDVIRRARSAAIEDTRFSPVGADELKEIEIEVSVLTVPQRLAFTSPQDLLSKLRPGVDGVVLRVGNGQATYLPQVWEQIPDKRTFIDELAEKAGLAADAWTRPEAEVMTYQVEAFKEKGDGLGTSVPSQKRRGKGEG
jgi:MEMO1 family protein